MRVPPVTVQLSGLKQLPGSTRSGVSSAAAQPLPSHQGLSLSGDDAASFKRMTSCLGQTIGGQRTQSLNTYCGMIPDTSVKQFVSSAWQPFTAKTWMIPACCTKSWGSLQEYCVIP